MRLVKNKQNISTPKPDSIPDSSSPDSSSLEEGSNPDSSSPEAVSIPDSSSPEADSIPDNLGKIKLRIIVNHQYIKAKKKLLNEGISLTYF